MKFGVTIGLDESNDDNLRNEEVNGIGQSRNRWDDGKGPNRRWLGKWGGR